MPERARVESGHYDIMRSSNGPNPPEADGGQHRPFVEVGHLVRRSWVPAPSWMPPPRSERSGGYRPWTP